MELQNIKIFTDILQNIFTILGFLAAGIWSYYTYVVGRSNAPNVKLYAEILEHSKSDAHRTYIITRIKAQNVGRTKVKKQDCDIEILGLTPTKQAHNTQVSVDNTFDMSKAQSYKVFSRSAFLEPQEEVTEDLLLYPGDAPLLKLMLSWNSGRHIWNSTVIIEI